MDAESVPHEQLTGHEPKMDPSSKPKIVVIMGATGSGKSKLAIDLASHFPVEIINADSMQVSHLNYINLFCSVEETLRGRNN